MSIRGRIFLVTFTALTILLLAVFFITNRITDNIISRWTYQYADREVAHAVRRTVDPIRSDLTIINEIAENEKIIAWGNNPTDPDLRREALEYLNYARYRMTSSTYFIALKGNNSYYYNDLEGNFSGNEYQYQLSLEKNEDQWFYSTLQSKNLVNLNVDFDRGLEITSLWINLQIRDGEDVLGVVGTGFEIDEFLARNLTENDSRFENFFIDKDGAIQLANDRNLIVNAAISINDNNKPLIFEYLSRPQDEAALRAALSESEDLRIVNIEWFGKKVLLFITYISDLEWYSVTAVDASSVLNQSDFKSLFIALVLFSFCFVVGVLVAVLWYVERPIQHIMRLVNVMFDPLSPKTRPVVLPLEYQKLINKIEAFAYFDPLTGLLNRRGLDFRARTMQETFPQGCNFVSLTVMDIDHFKKFNDVHGHLFGDQALVSFAEKLKIIFKEEEDICARIGGEEFVVMTFSSDKSECVNRLENFLHLLRSTCICKNKHGDELFITASAGMVIMPFTEFDRVNLQDIVAFADEQLYTAKARRDCVQWICLPELPAPDQT